MIVSKKKLMKMSGLKIGAISGKHRYSCYFFLLTKNHLYNKCFTHKFYTDGWKFVMM